MLDPVVAYLPHEINSHKDQHVRRVLHPLALMAAELGPRCCRRHAPEQGRRARDPEQDRRSVGFGGAARSVLYFTRDPDDPDGERGRQRVIAHAKCNVGPEMPSLHAQIEAAVIHDHKGEPMATSRLVLGDASDYTARDLLANGSVGGEEATARGEAKTMLLDELADGPRRVVELKQAAERPGSRGRPSSARRSNSRSGREGSRPLAVGPTPARPSTLRRPVLDGLDGVEGVERINTINAVNGTDVMVLAERGEQILQRHADLNGGVA